MSSHGKNMPRKSGSLGDQSVPTSRWIMRFHYCFRDIFYDCSTMIVLLDHCDCYLFFLYKVDFQPCQLVSAAP